MPGPDTTPADLDALTALVAEKRAILADCDLGDGAAAGAAGDALADAADVLLAEVQRLRAEVAARPPYTSPYAGPDETPCGDAHPEGGRACELRHQHAVHIRKVSGGWDAWIAAPDLPSAVVDDAPDGAR